MRASTRAAAVLSGIALSITVALVPANVADAALPAAVQPSGVVVKASPAGAGSLQVTWSSSSALARYRVQYSMMPGMTDSRSVVVAGNGTTLTGLLPKTRYWVRVRTESFTGAAVTDFTSATSAETETPADADAAPLRVATYNIRSVRKQGKGKPWKVRRLLLADAIKSQHLAVLGLQEAEHWKVAGGATQYQDIVNLLGGGWKIVETVDTDGTRIAYDSDQVTLVSSGVRELASNNKPQRWVVYSVFEQKSNGRQFFFANAHLISSNTAVASSSKCSGKTPKYYSIRKKEANQVASTIAEKSGKLPVVLVGDMNSHKFNCPSNAPYLAFKASGLVDPLDNTPRLKAMGSPTAPIRIHTEFDSSNHYAAAPKRHPWPLGTHIDYVWVSPRITTLEYELVVNITASGKFVGGKPPSDHNMVRATILVPAS